jgi:hypothetical protein
MTTIPVNRANEAVEGYEYLHEYRILVCKEHGFGLRNLRRHLLEQHSYSRYARDAIIERFGNLDIVNPEDASLPPSGVEPFESLLSPNQYKLRDGIQLEFQLGSRSIRLFAGAHGRFLVGFQG